MTDAEAIDEAIRRTGVERYRFLCSDANALPPPNAPADFLRLVREIATGPAPGMPTATEAVALTRAMKSCPFRSTPACGCGGPRCALRGGAPVSHLDCFPCVERYG